MDAPDDRSPKRIRDEKTIENRGWEDLPIDCLVEVFMRLDIDDMALGVPFVCKSWYEASLDPKCWKNLDIYAIKPSPGQPFAERFKHEYRLDVFTMKGFLKFIINRSQKLVRTIILPTAHIPMQDLLYVLEECPQVSLRRRLEDGTLVPCISHLAFCIYKVTRRRRAQNL